MLRALVDKLNGNDEPEGTKHPEEKQEKQGAASSSALGDVESAAEAADVEGCEEEAPFEDDEVIEESQAFDADWFCIWLWHLSLTWSCAHQAPQQKKDPCFCAWYGGPLGCYLFVNFVHLIAIVLNGGPLGCCFKCSQCVSVYEVLCICHLVQKRFRTTRVGGSKVCASPCQLVNVISTYFNLWCFFIFRKFNKSDQFSRRWKPSV